MREQSDEKEPNFKKRVFLLGNFEGNPQGKGKRVFEPGKSTSFRGRSTKAGKDLLAPRGRDLVKPSAKKKTKRFTL